MGERDRQGEPPYRRIADEIRARIDSGELAPGDRVPSTRQIIQEWGVAMATATKVLTALRQEGVVRALPGIGTVVAGRARAPASGAQEPAGQRTLDRERIVRTAVAVADAEGLAALSMRRIAAELGVTTMALYRHVPGKEQLVLHMADHVFGEAALPDPPPPGPRERLELCARLHWDLYQRHAWLPHVVSITRPLVLPNAMAHTEWMMAAVDGLGLPPATMVHVVITVAGFVRGAAIDLEAEMEARQHTGITHEEWFDSHEPMLTELLESFTQLSRVPTGSYDTDSLFEFGLARLLDGVVSFIARR